jgi:hypothetical protein
MFNIGDTVIPHKDLHTFPNVSPSMNSTMLDNAERQVKLKVIEIIKTSHEKTEYYCSDGYYYLEKWLVSGETEHTAYHQDPKINKVIAKMKYLRNKRKELGYEF